MAAHDHLESDPPDEDFNMFGVLILMAIVCFAGTVIFGGIYIFADSTVMPESGSYSLASIIMLALTLAAITWLAKSKKRAS